MKLSRYEQETILLYNEAEETAQVYTYDTKLIKKLLRLSVKYPNQIICKNERQFTIPKSCVSVREPYSEERREAARERAKAGGFIPPRRESVSKKK